MSRYVHRPVNSSWLAVGLSEHGQCQRGCLDGDGDALLIRCSM